MRAVLVRDHGKLVSSWRRPSRSLISSAQRRLLQLFFAGTRREGPREALQRVLRLMNQRKHLFSPQEAPVFRRRIGPELNDLHIFRIIFIYLLPQMPSRSPKGEAPARVARRKARPGAPSDAFRPILPPAEARAGNKQLKIGRPGTRRLEIGRLWKGLIGDWRRLSMPGGLLPRRLRCWNLS